MLHLYAALSINCVQYEFCEPCSFRLVNILIQNIIYGLLCILSIYVIYDWITIIGYSKHEFSTNKHLYFLKKRCHITSLPPNNGQLSTTAPIFYPQGGRC